MLTNIYNELLCERKRNHHCQSYIFRVSLVLLPLFCLLIFRGFSWHPCIWRRKDIFFHFFFFSHQTSRMVKLAVLNIAPWRIFCPVLWEFEAAGFDCIILAKMNSDFAFLVYSSCFMFYYYLSTYLHIELWTRWNNGLFREIQNLKRIWPLFETKFG